MRNISLLIILTLINFGNLSYAQSKDFNGAEIRTMESFLYGKFEVKMKSVECSGMLSSFFTFYDSPDFTTNWNEIDIEILGRYNNEVQFNTITPGNGKRAPHEKRHVLGFNPHNDFHVYAIVWTPEYIAFEVDGKEAYRDSGDHIKEMNKPQKLMMNIWSTIWEEWTGKWDAGKVPLTAYYDYVKYYSLNEDKTFSLKWTDNFDKMDNGRWQLATHSFDGNLVQFTPNNAKFNDGKLSLILSKNTPVNTTNNEVVEKPKPTSIILESGKIKKGKIYLTFSNKIKKASGTDISNYSINGVSISKIKMPTDYSTEKQTIIIIPTTELDKDSLDIEVKGLLDEFGNELAPTKLSVKNTN